MTGRHRTFVLLLAAAALGGCMRRFVPAPFGTPLDEACNPVNGNVPVTGDTFRVGSALVPVTRGWSPRINTPNDLTLLRMDAELNVWQGNRYIPPSVEPMNAVRCQITRGDTIIHIQAARLRGFAYLVNASWQPMINGQLFYMELQTKYVDHLKAMRAMIEAVRFPVDTTVARTK